MRVEEVLCNRCGKRKRSWSEQKLGEAKPWRELKEFMFGTNIEVKGYEIVVCNECWPEVERFLNPFDICIETKPKEGSLNGQ